MTPVRTKHVCFCLFLLGAASEFRVRYHASKTGFSSSSSFFSTDRSNAVPLLQLFFVCHCFGGFISGVCYDISYTSSLLLLVPPVDCFSRLLHFQDILTYTFREAGCVCV